MSAKNTQTIILLFVFVFLVSCTCQAAPRKQVIVIDPGHGGKDSGAIGPTGLYEKTVVLNVSQKLLYRLRNNPNYKVHITRYSDKFIPLQKRREIAYKKNADLFVSIHCDGFNDPKIHGLSAFVLSNRGKSQTINLSFADKKYLRKAFPGYKKVSLSQARRKMHKTVLESSRFAKYVLYDIQRRTKAKNLGIKHAGFAVLKSLDIPSTLLEIGFITNYFEEKMLKTNSYRLKIADAIAAATNRYMQNANSKN